MATDSVNVKIEELEELFLRSSIINYEETFEEMHLDVTRLFMLLHDSVDRQIVLATQKAQLILAANLLLTGALVFDRGFITNTLFGSSATLAEQLQLLIMLGMIGAMLMSIMFALKTARPKLIATTRMHNLFFFGHIVQLSEDDFVNRFMHMNIQDIKRALLTQIYAKSRILDKKFLFTRYSMTFMFAALLLLAMFHLVNGVIV